MVDRVLESSTPIHRCRSIKSINLCGGMENLTLFPKTLERGHDQSVNLTYGHLSPKYREVMSHYERRRVGGGHMVKPLGSAPL